MDNPSTINFKVGENQDFNDIFKELLNGNCDNPNLLSKYLIQLSAHLFNLDKNRQQAERKYAELWQKRRNEFKTDKQAEIGLKLSDEWSELENSKNIYKMTMEIIRAAKKRLNVLSDEARMNY